MSILTRAHDELFRRNPDDCFPSLEALRNRCEHQRQCSQDLWPMPQDMRTVVNGHLHLGVGHDHELRMNDWSFTQLCRISGINRDTVNRLTPDTAARVFDENFPRYRDVMPLPACPFHVDRKLLFEVLNEVSMAVAKNLSNEANT